MAFNFQSLQESFRVDGKACDYIPNVLAIDEMERRIKKVAFQARTIYYSDLVDGIPFFKKSLFGNEAHYIVLGEGWTFDERRMVGTALAEIAIRNYEECGCLITSVVTLKGANEPSPTFFDWLGDHGIPADEDGRLKFWLDELRNTFDYYHNKRKRA